MAVWPVANTHEAVDGVREGRRRGQRSSVPGVTIRQTHSLFGHDYYEPVRTARSVQDVRGLGFVRRCTVTISRLISAASTANR